MENIAVRWDSVKLKVKMIHPVGCGEDYATTEACRRLEMRVLLGQKMNSKKFEATSMFCSVLFYSVLILFMF